ncbi:MAG TPA: YARHG domain-containing protein [Phaeodactylibacter sp.]|nr:YARHG domain-containing protein [Phaeodactylibacter sp.]
MSRLHIIAALLLLHACERVTQQDAVSEPSYNRSPYFEREYRTSKGGGDRQEAFEDLIVQAMEKQFVFSEDVKTRELIHQLFPHSTAYKKHHITIEPLALRDSFWLLMYEFVREGEQSSPLYLGSFQKSGQVIDLLEILSTSMDGHISLNLLEEDILEIEYSDHEIRSGFPLLQAKSEEEPSFVLPVRSAVKEAPFFGGVSLPKTSGVKYYYVQPEGIFLPLLMGNRKKLTALFPELSDHILTKAELKELKAEDYNLKRKESTEGTGYWMEDSLLQTYFEEKGWYEE